MAKLRHIAITVPDPEKAAKFYMEAFGLKRVGETDWAGASGVYLSDGVVNIALLRYKTEEMAGHRGRGFVGVHHFGFVVEDVAAAREQVEAAGAKHWMGEPREGGGFGIAVKMRVEDKSLPQSDLAPCDLWASDGTAAGTVPFASLPPVEFFSNPRLTPVVAGSHFYFFAVMPGETVLYRSDGTTAGTQPLGSFDASSYPLPEVAEAGGAVYVSTDGVLRRLAASGEPDLVLGQSVTGLRELNGRLLFFGASFESPPRTGLWSTDGTEAGTVLLSPVLEQTLELVLGIYGSPQWTRLGSRLLFRGWDPAHGFELWATDGTPGGTVLVRDIAPGTGSSFPDFLTPVGSEVWFAANDGVHGDELWSSDGTPGGTRLRADLVPGPGSSSPQWLTLAGANLFFSADLALTGREPWVLPLQ